MNITNSNAHTLEYNRSDYEVMNTTANNTNITETTSDLYSWEYAADFVFLAILVYLTVCDIIAATCKKSGNDGKPKSNNKILMDLSSVLSGIIASSSCIMGIVSYFLDHTPLSFSIKASLMLLPLMAIYMVLWLRQANFYSNPALRSLTPIFGHGLRYFVGFIIPSGAIVFVILLIQQSLKNRCVVLMCIPNWLFLVMVASQVEVQVAILALFIYPLWKHHRMMASGAYGRSPDYVMKVIKRATIITIITIICDSAALVIFLIWKNGTVFNFNLVFNLICIKFCFVDWKSRLLPCTTYLSKTPNHMTLTSMT